MPSERRFRYDGTKATRLHKPDYGDDRMNENDKDVVHAGIVSKSQKARDSGRLWNSPPTGTSGSTALAQMRHHLSGELFPI